MRRGRGLSELKEGGQRGRLLKSAYQGGAVTDSIDSLKSDWESGQLK